MWEPLKIEVGVISFLSSTVFVSNIHNTILNKKSENASHLKKYGFFYTELQFNDMLKDRTKILYRIHFKHDY